MIHILFFITTFISLFCNNIYSENYQIDVIIPCTAKDYETLEYCIEGIKKNCSQVRRIIVISSEKITDNAEWFNEENFPFQKYDIALQMFHENEEDAKNYVFKSGSRVGWYYQQLLKLYSLFVIPEILPNVLVLDSDTIFLNPVVFLDDNCVGLYNPGSEYHSPYFGHINRLTKGKVKKLNSKYSGITHHMLFQKDPLIKLFELVESIYNREFWKAFCFCVDRKYVDSSGASEYELYFNYILKNSPQAEIRHLKWKNLDNINDIPIYKKKGFHYVSCHSYLKK